MQVSEFDNQISLLYKWASYYKQPARYILPLEKEDTLVYEPLPQYMSRLLQDQIPLSEIYFDVIELSPALTPNDIAMTFVNLEGANFDLLTPLVNQFYRDLELERLKEEYRRAAYDPELINKLAQPQDQYRNPAELRDAYNNWLYNFNQMLQRDSLILNRILETQRELSQQEALPVSPLVFDNITVALSPISKTTHLPVNSSDGIDIFNDAHLSLLTPFVQLSSEEENPNKGKFYKIYQSDMNEAPDYSELLPKGIRVQRPGILYSMIRIDDMIPIHHQTRYSKKYTQGTYDLNKNNFVISSPITPYLDENFVIQRVSSLFPSLDFNVKHREVKVSGRFNVYNVEISDYTFMDMILNNPIMSTYLFVEESLKSYANKKRMGIRYKSLVGEEEEKKIAKEGYIKNTASVSAKLEQDYADGTEDFLIQTPLGVERTVLPFGTPYIRVRISSAENRKVSQQFVDIFRRLLDLYRKTRPAIEESYAEFIPGITYLAPRPPQPQPSPLQTPPPIVNQYPPALATIHGTPGQIEPIMPLVPAFTPVIPPLPAPIIPSPIPAPFTQPTGPFPPVPLHYLQLQPQSPAQFPPITPLTPQPQPQAPAQFPPPMQFPPPIQSPGRIQLTTGEFLPAPPALPKQTPRRRTGGASYVSSNESSYVATGRKAGPGAPVRGKEGKRIDLLKKAAPDVFIPGYARDCQYKMQPVIVTPQEAPLWQQRAVTVGGMTMPRQIMSFPPPNTPGYGTPETPTVLLTCPGDDYPFIGVKYNKKMDNREKYPCLPCCFQQNQMDPHANTKYNECYRGLKRNPNVAPKATHKMVVPRILDPERVGILPKPIANLVSQYSEESGEIERYGVIRSVNSLIHCVLVALHFPEYYNLSGANPEETNKLREVYAQNVRRRMLGTIRPSTYKQELYDISDTEIERRIADPELFLDPQLYYRGLEELFNVNIYVFTPETLEIPRRKQFHTRPIRGFRPTLIIYKHSGATGGNVEYPQCELIVDSDPEAKEMVKLYDIKMTQLLFRTLTSVQDVITWQFEGTDIVARNNIYSRKEIDYFTVVRRSAQSQILDDYGKLRGLIILTSAGYATLAVLPSQPENLPIASEYPSGRADVIVKLFQIAPTAVTRDNQNRITGVWFPIEDLQFGMYFPVELFNGLNELPLGPPNPLLAIGSNVISRTKRLYRTLEIFLQLVRWLFIIAQITAPLDANNRRTPVSPEAFAQKYFQILQQPKGVDTSRIYDFSKLPRKLPQVNSVEDAIRIMTESVPTMFLQGKINMYSQTFGERVLLKLKEFYKVASPLPIQPMNPKAIGEDWKIPTEIEGLFSDVSDFRQQPHVLIFIGEKDLNTWLSSINRPSYTSLTIVDRLNVGLGRQTEPYVYIDTRGKIYLVQNVTDGIFENAISVAYTWALRKVNMGFQAEAFRGLLPAHVIYRISTGGMLEVGPDDDRSGGVGNFLQILTYGAGVDLVRDVRGQLVFRAGIDQTRRVYAALLPLI